VGPGTPSIDRGDGIVACLVRLCLQIRLIELDHIGAGCLQVLSLGVHGFGIGHRERGLVPVVLVLGLLRHGERPRERDLDAPVGVAAQELDVAHLDGVTPADRTHDARH
jgi:hypothetical protein